jgi:hypothetical protein
MYLQDLVTSKKQQEGIMIWNLCSKALKIYTIKWFIVHSLKILINKEVIIFLEDLLIYLLKPAMAAH